MDKLTELLTKEAAAPTHKVCTKCGEEKPLSEFYKRSEYVYENRCKQCNNMAKHWNRAKKIYNCTQNEYEQMYEDQGGVCAICGRPETRKRLKRLSIDHDHSTGEVRALLCSDCNAGLGRFGDDPERLRSAAAYLEKYFNTT